MDNIILKIAVDSTNSYEDFIVKMNEIGFVSRYQIRIVSSPIYEFRDDFIDYIAENGMSSLIAYTASMEDITSPSMAINDSELVLSKFIGKLGSLKRLLIIDPYFYAASSNAHHLLERLLIPHQGDLTEVTVICNNISASNAANMRSSIKSAAPNSIISEIKSTKFHDRFWINPDAGLGLVMGTSLNGIGKKNCARR